MTLVIAMCTIFIWNLEHFSLGNQGRSTAASNKATGQILDSLSTKRNLQRKLNPNVTQISQPMTVGGVANSPLFIGFQN